MNCKNCGNIIPDGAAFCTVCGTPVEHAEQAGQNTAGQAAGATCAVCGAVVPPGASVCPNCGTVLQGAPIPAGYKPRSKVVAALFAFLLGSFGIQNFYLGYTNKAIVQLILAILCCGTVSYIWSFIEGILILTESISVDGNGVPLDR